MPKRVVLKQQLLLMILWVRDLGLVHLKDSQGATVI